MNKQDQIDLILNLNKEELSEFIKIKTFDKLLLYTPYIERMVRSSIFYNMWRMSNKILDNADTDVIELINTKDLQYTKINQHHVITLFEIVNIIGSYLLDTQDITSPFEVAELVLREHILSNIPWVPLLITSHSKYHDGLIEIPKDKIKGNIHEFINRYKDYISEEQLCKLI